MMFAAVLNYNSFRSFAQCCYGALLFLSSINVVVKGEPSHDKQGVLYVSNHTSYMDILAIGTVLKANFVAKKDVRSWPLVNIVAIMMGTVFVERNPKMPYQEVSAVRKALKDGKSLILFPEGTTGDGNHILKFKSAMFKIVEEVSKESPLIIQPISIAYTHIGGKKTNAKQRSELAWYGDVALVPHLWNLLKYRNMTATIEFVKPSTYKRDHDRKKVAKSMKAKVEKSYKGLIS